MKWAAHEFPNMVQYPHIRQSPDMYSRLFSPLTLLTFIALVSITIAFTYVNSNSGSYIINPLEFNSDTHSYLSTIDYFRQILSGDVHLEDMPPQAVLTRALTTPLMLLSALVVGDITGNDAYGIIAINILLYFLLVPVFYRIGILVFNDTKTAFIATILLLTNWVLFSFGTTFLVDMGGWFFFLLTTLLSLEYYRSPSRRGYFYAAILSSIIGVFFKEYGALGIVTLALLICIQSKGVQEKIKDLLIAGLSFGVIFLAYHLFFYLQYQYTYFSWYGHNYLAYAAPESTKSKHELSHLVRITALIFLLGWPLFLLGALRLVREIKKVGTEKLMVLSAMLPASLAFLVWPAFTHRIAFILIPWAALVAAYGLASLKNRWGIAAILALYALFNFNVDVLTSII